MLCLLDPRETEPNEGLISQRKLGAAKVPPGNKGIAFVSYKDPSNVRRTQVGGRLWGLRSSHLQKVTSGGSDGRKSVLEVAIL